MPIMKPDELDHILEDYGDYLIRIWLSLWGEPLLNKRLPDLIAKCKSREIWVLVSWNMSVPSNDAAIEALVRSDLNAIILSIDGATQETYQEYRRGGDLALVFDNVRRLVATKRRLDLRTPHLYWRYLDFPWNHHEIELARTLAAELGVDEFGVEPGVMTLYAKHALTPRRTNERRRTQPPDVSAAWQRLADAREARHQYFGCDYIYRASASIRTGSCIPAAMLSRRNMPSAMPARTATMCGTDRSCAATEGSWPRSPDAARPNTLGSIRACLAT